MPPSIPDSLNWPKALSNTCARIAHRRWCFGRAATAFQVNASDGAQYVECTLRSADEVCFHYEFLMGFTNSIKLATIVNTQLASIYALAPTYSVAKGPGRLLFRLPGSPTILEHAEDVPTVSPELLVAWARDCVFELTCSEGLSNFYFARPSLKVVAGTFLIQNADIATESASLGRLFTYIKRLLRPW